MSELAKAYFRLHHFRNKYEWAQGVVDKIYDQSMESGWALTLELLEAAQCLDDLEHVALTFLTPLFNSCRSSIFPRLQKIALTSDRVLYAMMVATNSPRGPRDKEFHDFAQEQLLYRDPKLALDLPETLEP